MSFSQLGLSSKVLSAVTSAGFETPTPIQAQAVPHAVAGRDVLGIAQTGTGKTASFVLPMLTRLERGRARARMPRSLILEPTRELAAQVADVALDRQRRDAQLGGDLLVGQVAAEVREDLDLALGQGLRQHQRRVVGRRRGEGRPADGRWVSGGGRGRSGGRLGRRWLLGAGRPGS